MKTRLSDWLIELANRGFDLSTDAVLKSVKKFLDKEYRTIPFREVVSELNQIFIPSPFIKLFPNIQF